MKPPKSAQTILEVKSRKGHRAREAIFEAAIRVAGAEGLAALNVSRIAEVAGIGRASFYNYFDSVDDVVAELMKRLQEELEEALTEVHGEFDRGAARFAACVGEVVKRLSEDADFANLCREAMRGSEEVREQFRKASRPEIEAASCFAEPRCSMDLCVMPADRLRLGQPGDGPWTRLAAPA